MSPDHAPLHLSTTKGMIANVGVPTMCANRLVTRRRRES